MIFSQNYIKLNKLSKTSLTIIKILIFFFAYYFIYTKIRDINIHDFKLDEYKYSYLIFAFLLMFINWSIEAFKWKFLIKNFERISFFTALKSITIGIVFGLFTPNRLGEIPGKTVLLKKENRIKGAIAASVGSFAQFCITFIFGLLGIAFLIFFTKNSVFYRFLTHKTAIGLIFFASLLLFIYFNPKKILSIIQKTRLSSKIISKFEVLLFYGTKTLLKLLLISCFRYLIFSLQYYFLLLFFQINLPLTQAFASIFSVFFLINILPHFVIADLGIRGTISIFVFSRYVSSVPEIIGAPIILWLINVLMPAIAGQIFISKLKTSKL